MVMPMEMLHKCSLQLMVIIDYVDKNKISSPINIYISQIIVQQISRVFSKVESVLIDAQIHLLIKQLLLLVKTHKKSKIAKILRFVNHIKCSTFAFPISLIPLHGNQIQQKHGKPFGNNS